MPSTINETGERSPFVNKFSNLKLTDSKVEADPTPKKPEYLDCPLNWIEFLKCGINAHAPGVKKYIQEWSDVQEKRLAEMLKFTPTEYFSKKTIHATHLSAEDPNAACIMLDNLAKNVLELDSTRCSEYYKEGLMNLIMSTKQEIQLRAGINTTMQEVPIIPKMLEELSDEAKCPILAAKLYFCRVANGSPTYQRSLAEKILSYDQSRAEWHFIHHSSMRDWRHQDATRFRYRPDGVEIDSLGRALMMEPDNTEFQVSVVKTLHDCLKSKSPLYIKIGNIEFANRGEVEKYLTDLISNAVKENTNCSVRGLLAAAQAISNYRLPEALRNVVLAEQLLNKALGLWPSSSKILFQTGRFLLNEKKDVEAAKVKFQQALQENPNDAVSVLNYYWIAAASTDMKEKCVQAIEEKLDSKVGMNWPGHMRLDLLFLKGCIYFSMSKTAEALKDWAVAQALEFRYFMTKLYGLHTNLRKFSWKRLKDDGTEDEMFDSYIRKQIDEFLKNQDLPPDEIEESEFGNLARILKVVRDARSKPKPEQNGKENFKASDGADSGNWRSDSNSSKKKDKTLTRGEEAAEDDAKGDGNVDEVNGVSVKEPNEAKPQFTKTSTPVTPDSDTDWRSKCPNKDVGEPKSSKGNGTAPVERNPFSHMWRSKKD